MGDLKMDRSACHGHQIPALDHPHLEAGDDARAPGARRRARALSKGEPPGGQGLAGIDELRRRDQHAPRPRSASTPGRASRCKPWASSFRKKLRRYVPVFEEHAVDHDLLAEGARNLRDYFQSQGYFDAEVQFKQQTRRNDEMPTIDYLVNTGTRHKLVRIGIAGNRYFNTASIRERMFLRTATFLQFPHGRYSAACCGRDEESIVEPVPVQRLSRREGDSPRARTITGQDRATWPYSSTIDEGPQYFVGSLEVEGIEHLDKAAIMAQLSSIAGPAVQRIQRGGGSRRHSGAVFREAVSQRHLRVELQAGGQAAPRGPALHDLAKAASSSCARCVHRRPAPHPARPGVPQHHAESRRSAFAHRDHRYPAQTLRPGNLRAGGYGHPGSGRRDRPTNTSSTTWRRRSRYSWRRAWAPSWPASAAARHCLDAPAGSTGFSPRFSFDVTRNNLWGMAHSISLRTRVSTLDQRGLLNYNWPRFRGNDNLTVSFTGLYRAVARRAHIQLQARRGLGAVVSRGSAKPSPCSTATPTGG